MPRQDQEYWQRLRVDKRSGIAALLSAAAAICTALNILMATIGPISQAASRANPAYWLVFLPMAWWVVQLVNYEPLAVRYWRYILLVFCIVNGGIVLVLNSSGELESVTMFIAAAAVVCAASSLLAYRGSLVAKEGPAR